MEQQYLALGLDIVIAVLLCVTIVYAFLLNKRLQALRADRAEMESLLRKFYDATTKADASIKGLKATAESSGKELQEVFDKARSLRDELSFMLERGDLLANQIDSAISASRPETAGQSLENIFGKKADAASKKAGDAPMGKAGALEALLQGDSNYEPKSAAEKELLKALKGVR